MLDDIAASYRRHCAYLTGDRLRGVIRTNIESLNAIRLRPTGGVYFIHRRHARTLAALRELVRRFGAGSHLARVPLPDQDEMREMVVTAWRTKVTDDLNRLARDVAAAQRDDTTMPPSKHSTSGSGTCRPPPPSKPSCSAPASTTPKLPCG